MNPIEKIKNLFTNHKKFFSIVTEEPLKETFVYYIFLAIINLGLTFITIQIFLPYKFLGSWIVSLVMVFIVSGIMHIFLQLLKKADIHDYESTLKILIYASTPYILLSWIPIVRIIGTICMFYFVFIGLKQNYETNTIETVITLLSPFIVGLVLVLLF